MQNISITGNQIYPDFSAKLLSLQWSSIEILALAKSVKPSPFVRSKDWRFPAERPAYFVQNTALKSARKSRQFMKVHVGSDEKFSTFFRFAWFEFFHSLQVVFQFINTDRDQQVCSAANFHLSVFSGVVPFPSAAMKSF